MEHERLIFFLLFKTRPDLEHPRFSEIGGAVAQVWVAAGTAEEAAARAEHYLGEHW